MEYIVIREKTTGAIDMQLLGDGSAIDLSLVSRVEMKRVDSMKQVYSYSTLDATSSIAIFNDTTGMVRFTPPNETTFRYLRQPYKLHWNVYTTSAVHYSVPDEEDAEIQLIKEY